MRFMIALVLLTGCSTTKREGTEVPREKRALMLRIQRESDRCAVCSESVEAYEKCMAEVKKFK